jgi:hypothetical protein
MNDLIHLLHQLEQSGFYGAVEVKFEAGVVVLLKKIETFKPTHSSYGDNRGVHERNQSHR